MSVLPVPVSPYFPFSPTGKLFASLPVFAGLDDVALDLLATYSEERRFEQGAVIVNEGDPGSEMFIIGDGSVEIVKRLGTENEVVLATLTKRNFFGEMCLIECVARSASVRAAEPTVLFALSARSLLAFYKKWPEQHAIIILNIARDVSRRLRALDEAFCARAD
ncbi:cyclic nucleotide-binding protein [Verrucomicrobia bacterium LW23]|nr:cyclic nucleotide-binding protein [Verrucomicrobia bacterium LW23]